MIHISIGPHVADLLRERRERHIAITPDLDFIKEGIVDSLSLLRFVLDLEKAFAIELSNEEIASLEFRTFAGVCAIIERKLQP